MARRKKKKSFGTNRIFLLGFLPALVLAGVVLRLSVRSLGQRETCGCEVVEKEATGNFDSGAKIAYFENQPIVPDFQEISPLPESLALEREAVLGVTTDDRWIEIDLSEQRLKAHDGQRVVYNFLVSTGKWGRTPTGTYHVYQKLKYTKMSGGSRELHTYYYLPNVPYVMYFYKGFGMHGTYWHQNFGQPMSHGCINLATPDAEKLFYWSSPVLPEGQKVVQATKDNPGIKVVIHD